MDTQIRSVGFTAGYAFKYIEKQFIRKFVAKTSCIDIVDHLMFPKVWINGNTGFEADSVWFSARMEQVMQELTDVCQLQFGSEFMFVASWSDETAYHNQIKINFRISKRAPKRMTVRDIEKELGYKVEIVSESQ